MKLSKLLLTGLLLVNTLNIFPVTAEEVPNNEEEVVLEEEFETAEPQEEMIIPEETLMEEETIMEEIPEVEEINEEEVEAIPTEEPVIEVTPEPTPEPTVEPTPEVTPEPTLEPTPESTPEITVELTDEPENPVEEEPVVLSEETPEPTIEPTPEALEEVVEEEAVYEEIDESELLFAEEPQFKGTDASTWLSESKAGTVKQTDPNSGAMYYVKWNNERKTAYFKLNITENSLLSLGFNNPNGQINKYAIKIYQAGKANNPVWHYNTEVDANNVKTAYMYEINLPKGTYYFTIENLDKSAITTFSFLVLPNVLPNMEIEPNNSASTATELNLNYFYYAYYAKGLNNDKDCYKIDLQKGQYYNLIVDAMPDGNGTIPTFFQSTTKLDVIAPSGKNIGSDLLEKIKKYNTAAFEAPETGTYQICISDTVARPRLYYLISFKDNIINLPIPQMTGVYNSVKGIDVRWKKVNSSEVTGYMIWRKNKGETKLAGRVDANTTQFYDEEVKNEWGRIYTYFVSAAKGDMGGATPEKGRSICRLAPPTLNEVSDASNTSAKVKWTFADKAAGYYIQYATNSSFTNPKYKIVEGRNTLETTVTGLTKGTKYYFRVRSYRPDDNNPSITYYSQWTSVKEFTPGQQTPIPQITAIYNSSKGVDFRFKPVDGASHYVIWRKNQGVWTKLDTVPASSLAKEGSSLKYFDASVKDHYGKIYVYSVAAICNGKEGKYNEKGRGICRLEPPRYPSVKEVDAGIRVMWDWVDKTDGYEIQVATKSDFSDARKLWAPGRRTTSQVVGDVKQGQTYYIRVRSRQIDSHSIIYWSQYTKVLKITPINSH